MGFTMSTHSLLRWKEAGNAAWLHLSQEPGALSYLSSLLAQGTPCSIVGEQRLSRGTTHPCLPLQNRVPPETIQADLQVSKATAVQPRHGPELAPPAPDQAGFLSFAWFCRFLLCLLPWEAGG